MARARKADTMRQLSRTLTILATVEVVWESLAPPLRSRVRRGRNFYFFRRATRCQRGSTEKIAWRSTCDRSAGSLALATGGLVVRSVRRVPERALVDVDGEELLQADRNAESLVASRRDRSGGFSPNAVARSTPQHGRDTRESSLFRRSDQTDGVTFFQLRAR